MFDALECSEPGKHLLFIDQCKLAPGTHKKIEKILLEKSGSQAFKTVAIHPDDTGRFYLRGFEGEEGLEGEKRLFVPFSAQLIFNLCYRALNRKEHETMDYGDVKTLQIILSFLRMYENVESFKNEFGADMAYNRMLKLNFYYERAQEDDDSPQKDRKWARLEEFVILARNAINSIQTPFGSIKGLEYPEIASLASFVRAQAAEGADLADFVSFGDLDEWDLFFGKLCADLYEEEQGGDVCKENDWRRVN